MEKLGYIISEAPVFFLLTWFAVRWVQYRRQFTSQPVFSDRDRRLLFHAAADSQLYLEFYLKLTRAILLVTAIGLLEIIIFAPLGAAILTGMILLTSAIVVHRTLAFAD